MRQFLIVGFLAFSSLLRAAPIPGPPFQHGDYVHGAPAQATTSNAKSSSKGHPGVVVGGPNQFDKYQVATITHNPPPGMQHQPLTNVHPGSTIGDPKNSHISVDRPATYHSGALTDYRGASPMTHPETNALKNTIHSNVPGSVWKHPPTTPAPPPTGGGGAIRTQSNKAAARPNPIARKNGKRR